jgi:hypothetical protein
MLRRAVSSELDSPYNMSKVAPAADVAIASTAGAVIEAIGLEEGAAEEPEESGRAALKERGAHISSRGRLGARRVTLGAS